MKSCPACNRTYPDETLAFCLIDGSILSAPYDPPEPRRRPAPRGSNAPPTEVLIAPTVAAERESPLQSTIRAPAPQVSPLHSEKATDSSRHKQHEVPEMLRWAVVLRGLGAIGFCLAILVWYAITSFERKGVVLFGAYFLIDGGAALVAGIKIYAQYKRGWLLVFDGILRLIVSLALLLRIPAEIGGLAVFLMTILTGPIQICAAIRLRNHITGVRFLAMAGVASILLVLAEVSVGYLQSSADLVQGTLIAINVVYFVIFGVLLMVFGFRMRSSVLHTG